MVKTYFIQEKGNPNSPVKIGRSVNPKKRLIRLQTGSPVKLTLLGTTELQETDLHVMFDDLRLCGEWFECNSELADFISSVLDIPLQNSFDDNYVSKSWLIERFNLMIYYHELICDYMSCGFEWDSEEIKEKLFKINQIIGYRPTRIF